jgi:hypothetical protein
MWQSSLFLFGSVRMNSSQQCFQASSDSFTDVGVHQSYEPLTLIEQIDGIPAVREHLSCQLETRIVDGNVATPFR